MARTAIRTPADLSPSLTMLPERVGILETKVENIDEKIDDLKIDVKDMHDCLDRTRDGILVQLETMHKSSCDQHHELAGKIGELEKFKSKWTTYIMILLAFGAGTGWFDKLDLHNIIKFVGL